MQEELLNALYDLRDAMHQDPRYLRLQELDKKLNDNEDVMKLSYKKEMMIIAYEDAISHFGKDSKEASLAQKKLYEAKLELDSHPLVREYLNALKLVRQLDEEVNKSLFYPFEKGNK